MVSEKLINKYNKKIDPMLWELVEVKHKLGKRNLTPKEINQNADNILHDFRERQKQISFVSDHKQKYNSKQDK
ncbi:MAG: hypothetical protein K1X86_14775 [Ignavibacteria bacterium]|nr:hypothetical protein [Ignavibacteria bacterium]